MLNSYVKNSFVKSGIELRVFLILMLLATSSKSECHQLLVPIMDCYSILPADKQKVIENWLTQIPKNEFIYLVESMKEIITLKFLAKKDSKNYSELKPFLVFLGILHRANSRTSIITHEEFYIDVITQETSSKHELIAWLKNQKNNNTEFTFIDYPFILNCTYKSEIWELVIKKERDPVQIMTSFLSLMNPEHLIFGLEELFLLKLKVRRDHLIEDTLHQLMKSNVNFQRTLKVDLLWRLFIKNYAIGQL